MTEGEQRLDREIEFFDRFAADHGEYDVLAAATYDRLTGLFEERIQPRSGEHCIDLGCGTGAFTTHLARFHLERTGMDISPMSVQRANERSNGARFVGGDITKTNLPEASFDIVVYSGVLHHFDSRASRERVLQELLCRLVFSLLPGLHVLLSMHQDCWCCRAGWPCLRRTLDGYRT